MKPDLINDMVERRPDFKDKLEPIIIYPLDPMANKVEIEYNSKKLFQSFFSTLNDPIRLDILKLLAFENKSIKELKDQLGLPYLTLLGHIKAMVKKHYIIHTQDGEFILTDGGRIITRLLNKVAKYLDPKLFSDEGKEIIFPLDYLFR